MGWREKKEGEEKGGRPLAAAASLGGLPCRGWGAAGPGVGWGAACLPWGPSGFLGFFWGGVGVGLCVARRGRVLYVQNGCAGCEIYTWGWVS